RRNYPYFRRTPSLEARRNCRHSDHWSRSLSVNLPSGPEWFCRLSGLLSNSAGSKHSEPGRWWSTRMRAAAKSNSESLSSDRSWLGSTHPYPSAPRLHPESGRRPYRSAADLYDTYWSHRHRLSHLRQYPGCWDSSRVEIPAG